MNIKELTILVRKWQVADDLICQLKRFLEDCVSGGIATKRQFQNYKKLIKINDAFRDHIIDMALKNGYQLVPVH